MPADKRLKIALVRYPHQPEETIVRWSRRIGQDRIESLSGQTPPLGAHVGFNAFWQTTLEPEDPLEPDEMVEYPAMLPPGERKTQREPFFGQASNSPWNICNPRAFNEIRLRSFV